jgi:hypothetical protein
MKTLESILHLYLGCDVKHKDSNQIFKLTGYDISSNRITMRGEGEIYCQLTGDYKPILRPLDSMTEEEEKHMISTQDDVKLDGYPQILLKADSGETFIWMLSNGFDLFGLIDSGLALNATKLEGYAAK